MFFPPVYFNRDYPEYSCLLLLARPDYLQIPLGLYPGYRVFDFSFSFLFFTYDAYTLDARRMPEWTTRWSTIVRCPLCHLMPNFRIVSLRPSNRSRNKFCQYETIVYRASLGNAISSFFPVLIPVCSRNDPRSSSFSSRPGSIRAKVLAAAPSLPSYLRFWPPPYYSLLPPTDSQCISHFFTRCRHLDDMWLARSDTRL